MDVPGSKLAFTLREQQIRYLAVAPKKNEPIDRIELVKGPDQSAPVVMAVTVEVAGANSARSSKVANNRRSLAIGGVRKRVPENVGEILRLGLLDVSVVAD